MNIETRHAAKADNDFVLGLARCLHVDYWLSTPEGREAEGPGVELEEAAPQTERWAIQMARRLTRQIIERHYPYGYDYRRDTDAIKAGEFKLTRILDRWRELAESDRYWCRPTNDETLGWYAGMTYLGHGVGLWEIDGFDSDKETGFTGCGEAYPDAYIAKTVEEFRGGNAS